MTDVGVLQEVLAGAYVDAPVFALRPDYRVLLLAVAGLVTGPSIRQATRCSRRQTPQPARRSACVR
jgi:hypothetical protein